MKDDLLTASERFSAAMAGFTSTIPSVQESMNRLGQRMTLHTLRMRRERYGGMKGDARAFPEQWQSTACAGLLCSVVVCPSDAHNLQCHHRCHGGA